MGRELGRISGPLLADNLRRNGTNLAFETRLLYLNVTGNRIGVNTLAPAYDLDVNDSFRTTNLNVSTQANLANLELYTNNIQNVVGNIVISPNQASNPTIVVPQLQATNLFFSGNTLSNKATDADINVSLAPGATTAQIKLNSNTLVDADLHATGDITWDGNITLGNNQAQDTVFFGSKISSDIVPDATTYDLGDNTTPSKWATAYVNSTTSTVIGIVDVTTVNLTGSGTNLLNGNVVIGTNSSNTLTVTAKINTNLIPSVTNTYTLGSATGPKYWNNVYGAVFNTSDITVGANTIQTNAADSSLRLVANGSGQVVFSKLYVTNNVTVGGTFGVTGASTLTNTTTGAITQTGNYNLIGDTGITGNLSSLNIAQIDNGTGGVGTTSFLLEDNTDLLLEDNSNLLFLETIGSSVFFQLPAVTITNSDIIGTLANTDLQITANGAGKILIPTNNAQFDQNLSVGQVLNVTSASTLTNTTAGAFTLTGDYNQTGDFVTTGSISSASITTVNPLTLPNVTIDGSVITGTVADTPLTLTAYTGKVVQITGSALIDQNLTVGQTLLVVGTTSLTNTTAGAITLAGDYNQTGNFVTTGTISSGGITATNPLVLPGLTFNSSTITGTLASSDLVLTAKAGQQVKITSSAKVAGDLSVGQTLTVGNTSTLRNTVTGAITLAGDYNQTGNFVTTGTIDSGSITAANPLTLPNITINGSVITGTVADTALTLTANAGQVVDITSNARIDNNLSVTGTLGVTNTSTLTNTTAGTITQTGDYNLTGNANITGNKSGVNITLIDNGGNVPDFLLEDGTDLLQEDGVSLLSLETSLLSSAYLQLPNVTISSSTVAGTALDTDLTFTANGTGKILVPSNDVRIEQDLTVGGTFTETNAVNFLNPTVGSITQTGDYNLTGNAGITGTVTADDIAVAGTGAQFDMGDFRISGQTITSSVVNGSITFQGNGAGAVWIDGYLKISGNRLINNWINASVPYTAEDLQIFVSEDNITLYTELGAPTKLQNSINLVPTGIGNVVVNSTKSLKLPAANDSNALLTDNGDIRFNNINFNIEGYKNTGYVSFINLYSQNYTTYATPELTPNASDHLIRFGIAGNVTTTISSTTVTSTRLTSGNITVSSNVIQNTDPATAVSFATSGSGLVKFNSVNFVNSNNFHVPTSGAISFASTGRGYVKFPGTNGLVIPSGTANNYPISPELGAVRFRTTDNVLQVYNGSAWVSADGGDSLTLDDIDDLVQVYTIVLG